MVSKERKNRVVDTKCRELTAGWVRAAAGKTQGGEAGEAPPEQTAEQASVELCDFYEVCFGNNLGVVLIWWTNHCSLQQLEATNVPNPIPNGVYTLEDLKEYCKRMKFCPYYLSRRAVRAQLLV